MTRDPRQAAAARPAAVAVHDDRNVFGYSGVVDRLGQVPIPVAWLERFE
jgi:hypothetical protein